MYAIAFMQALPHVLYDNSNESLVAEHISHKWSLLRNRTPHEHKIETCNIEISREWYTS